MGTELERLRSMVGALLAQEQLPSREDIRKEITRIRPATPLVTDDEAEKLAVEFESVHGVTMDIGSVLEEPDFEKWLDGAKAGIDFFYWERYRKLLTEQKFSGQVLATLDDVTERTLGLLQNPEKEGKWDRRGMIVGHVQSGKTANYIGLISKAADAGYKVIVVIAGIHNNLRNQTQSRIDEGFIGFDSSRLLRQSPESDRIIGVGRFDSRRRPAAFTNTLRDFNKQTATSIGFQLDDLRQPAIFVIKKNTHTLKNLLDWLREHNARRGTSSIPSPMLLIDDEADNASINIRKGSDEVSRINGQIRGLLKVFDRSCYVGYTATPFANIFIDPDSEEKMFGEDLFPRDFILGLDPPDNYFGPSRVFPPIEESDSKSSVVRYIEDNEDLLPLKHKIDHKVVGLPESLIVALQTFIVGRTIRLVRGHDTAHNSMLVNVSRFVSVQQQVRNEIHIWINNVKANIRVNSYLPEQKALSDPVIAGLEEVFRSEFGTTEVSWSQVQSRLWDSVSPINIIEVNSRASGSLDYDSHKEAGLNVIAVGGFSLSRGLTLKGLMVSYFLRNSMMYDTLMQMGRWFGYRQGYEDLCRVWMLEEAEGWYTHISESIEELREELRRMEAVNATPKEFGLKVRSHPDSLIVTARNKMGSGTQHTVLIGLGNKFVETATLLWDSDSVKSNHQAAVNLANSLSIAELVPENGASGFTGKLFKQVPVSLVLNFLATFRNHEGSNLTDTDPIREYINFRAETELSHWDVFFPSLRTQKDESLIDNSLGFKIICQRRKPGKRSVEGKTLLITEKQRVSPRRIEAVGLSKNEIKNAEEAYSSTLRKQSGNVNYPDRIYRERRERPLLIVHLLAIGDEGKDLRTSEPVVAWSISFRRTDYEEETVKYVVNTTWFRERYEDEDEDEAGGDDD